MNLDLAYNIFQLFAAISYSVGILNIFFMIFIYRTVKKDRGLFWTIIFMSCFVVIVIGMMMYPILENWELSPRILNFWFGVIEYGIMLSMAIMVYVIPAFTYSMDDRRFPADKKDIKGIIAILLMSVCITGLIAQSFRFPLFSPFVIRLITGSLIVSIVYSIFLGTIISFLKKNEKKSLEVKGYRSVAVFMARATFFFLPAFFFLDFFPMSGFIIPEEIQTRFSALPIFVMLWNYLLLRENLRSLHQFIIRSAPDSCDDVSFSFLEEKQLSKREMEVACLLVQGKSYSEIEEVLCISRATVKTHTNRIYKKTGFKNQNELIRGSLIRN